MTGSILTRASVVLLVTTTVAAAPATAAQRYASPSGTNSGPCSQSAPCDIVTAINQAGAGDDVTIEPGTYGSPTPLSASLTDGGHQLTIHGENGQDRPTILTTAANGIDLTGGSHLSGVRVQDAATTGIGLVTSGPASAIDHVFIEQSAQGLACEPNGTLTDSVCWASSSGASSTRVSTGSTTVTLVNDTLVVEDASFPQGGALAVGGDGSGTPTVNVTNTIAHGNPDVAASGGATLNLDHSSYVSASLIPGSPINDRGGNLSGSPTFLDAAHGDYHEAAGSPTIDAGTNSSSMGATDLDGTPRTLNGHTDIGAFERIPAPVCQPVRLTARPGVPVIVQLPCKDAVGAPLTYAIAQPATLGHASVNAATGIATYTPPAGFVGTDSFTFSAANAHGTTAPTAATVSILPAAPSLSHVQQLHRVWLERLPRRPKRGHHPPVGTRFTFALNVNASVTLTFSAHLPGRRVNGGCVAVTRHNRHRPTCTRTVRVGTLTTSGRAGFNSLGFVGRLGPGRILPTGNYAVVITARNAGGQSSAVTLAFRIA